MNSTVINISVRNNHYTLTPKAIGFYVIRDDGVVLRDLEYFPKSQIKYQVRMRTTEFQIPTWLFKHKISRGYSIME